MTFFGVVKVVRFGSKSSNQIFPRKIAHHYFLHNRISLVARTPVFHIENWTAETASIGVNIYYIIGDFPVDAGIYWD